VKVHWNKSHETVNVAQLFGVRQKLPAHLAGSTRQGIRQHRKKRRRLLGVARLMGRSAPPPVSKRTAATLPTQQLR
jgi:hypothetical protein